MTAARFPFSDFDELVKPFDKDRPASLFSNLLKVENKENEKLKEIFYSQKDLEEAKKQAFEEGQQHGMQKQKLLDEDFKAIVLQTLNTIISNIDQISADISLKQDDLISGCAELAFAIANKLKGGDEEKVDKNTILNFLNENFKYFIDEPSIKVKLNPETYLHIKDEIEKAYAEHKFQGTMTFVIDHALGKEDCAVEFQDASIKKSKQDIQKSIDEIYEKYIVVRKEEESSKPEIQSAATNNEQTNEQIGIQDIEKENQPSVLEEQVVTDHSEQDDTRESNVENQKEIVTREEEQV